jgi:large subunit ribosomal protein L30e
VEYGGIKMDIVKQLKSAMKSGTLLFGQNQAEAACAHGEAKLVIIAANCPTEYVEKLHASHPDIPMHQVAMVNRELGAACARPFHVSTICVVDAGSSDLLSLRSNLD